MRTGAGIGQYEKGVDEKVQEYYEKLMSYDERGVNQAVAMVTKKKRLGMEDKVGEAGPSKQTLEETDNEDSASD